MYFVIGIVIAAIILLALIVWLNRKPKRPTVAPPLYSGNERRGARAMRYDDLDDPPLRRYNRSPYAGKTQRRQEDDPLLTANAALLAASASSDARPAGFGSSEHAHQDAHGQGGFTTGEGFGGGGFEAGGALGGGGFDTGGSLGGDSGGGASSDGGND